MHAERELRKKYVSQYFGRRACMKKHMGSLGDPSSGGLHMRKEDFE